MIKLQYLLEKRTETQVVPRGAQGSSVVDWLSNLGSHCWQRAEAERSGKCFARGSLFLGTAFELMPSLLVLAWAIAVGMATPGHVPY